MLTKTLKNVTRTCQILLGASVTLFISGCASDPDIDPATGYPMWLMSEYIEGGLAASTCVPSSASFMIDKKMVVASARQELAQQIELTVDSLDKTYAERTDVKSGVAAGAVFSSVSQQLTTQTLEGARIKHMQQLDLRGVPQLCAQVALEPAQTEALFKTIAKNSVNEISPQDEGVLYQQFKAYQAQQELDKKKMENRQ